MTLQSDTPQLKIPITSEFLEEIRVHKRRTRIGTTRLLKNARGVPEGLTPVLIERWLNGTAALAFSEHLDFVLTTWRGLPSCTHKFVVLNQDTRDRLTLYRYRTDIGSLALLNQCSAEVPEGLQARMIDRWMEGTVKNAREDHLNFVLDVWETFPQYEFVELTPAIHAQLLKYKERSGIGVAPLLRGTRRERPEGLGAVHIHKWLKGPRDKVRKDYLDYVLKRWEYLSKSPEKRVPVTKETIKQLKRHKKRSGVFPTALLKRAADVPEGLNASIINTWFNGGSATAQKDHLDFVLNSWQELPDQRIGPTKRKELKSLTCSSPNRVVVTTEIIKQLKKYKENSGLGTAALLRAQGDVPEGLKAGILENVISGRVQTIRADYLEYILDLWERQVSKNTRLAITDKHLEQLSLYHRKGFLPGLILEAAEDVPLGLSASMISCWLSGQTKTAEREHWDYVVQRCLSYETVSGRRVKITTEMREALVCESNRTGLGPKKFLDSIKERPDEVSENMISSWLHGRAQTVRKDLYDFVLREWKQL